jgi:predicted Zn-dependent protease
VLLPWKLEPARFGTVAIIGVAVVGIAFIALVYGPQAYRGWRETRLMRHATTMLERGEYVAAATAARDALQIHPDSVAAFQVLAEASEKENKPETVAWRAQIARLLPDSLDSQLNLASAALRFGQLDVARRALERVSPRDREKAAYHIVAGWLARAQGNDGDVEQHFAAAVKQEPNNDLYQFNLAVLQIRSSDPEKSAAGRVTLQRLVSVAPYRAGSLRALLSDAIQKNELDRADQLAQELQLSQQVTFADYLLCLDFYRKLDEKKLGAVLDRVKPVAAKNPADLALLMDWMNRNSLAQEVLRWMDKLSPDLATHPPASIAIAEAFADVKNWSRLKRWTRNGSWGEADYLRLAYQAYATRQTRQSAGDSEYDSLWRAADHAASEKPEREIVLARLATKWNLPAEAEQLWLRVAKDFTAPREALEALFKIYRANNDLPNLYRTAQRLHENSPNEPDAAATYARLGLILDQNASDAQRVAKEAYDRNPNSASVATTYGFSLYSLGRTAEGLEVLRKLPEDELADSHLAVIAAVLLLDENRADEAQPYIEIARDGPLYPEEKKLLDEATAKAAAAPTPSPAPSAPAPASAAPSPPP